MENSELAGIISNLSLLEKISDSVRLVDPVGKHVVDMSDGKVHPFHCFEVWQKNKMCENCVSVRAFNDNMTYVKFEYNEEKIYMVTAVPIEYGGRRVVLELLKDATNSVFFDLNSHTNSLDSVVHALIDGLNNIALKDPLTGAYNRRYVGEKLPVDLVNAEYLSQHLSVMMLDVDLFKNVNDVHGHLAGDCVLKGLVETVSGCLKRSSDWVARYGGEEFIICLPGADSKRAKTIAEQIRRAIEGASFDCEKAAISVTASIGVFCIPPGTHLNVNEVIRNADERMYAAKRNGRNRVEL